MRRWTAGAKHIVSGITFRVVVGKKGEGDLRLEWLTGGGWRPIEMAVAFLLVDFFVENEEHLRSLRPHWRETGFDYFFKFLQDAVQRGWEAPSETLRGQQDALRPALVPDQFVGCGNPDPWANGSRCGRAKGHLGPHESDQGLWPVAS